MMVAIDESVVQQAKTILSLYHSISTYPREPGGLHALFLGLEDMGVVRKRRIHLSGDAVEYVDWELKPCSSS